jgi:aspartyl-tRNA(Asn)/glutamyl-tRNA(Gln) amidotransferase subunit B
MISLPNLKKRLQSHDMADKKYFPTIGLEIHAELKTNSKMFCGCKNDPDESNPNVNVCPVCMGHPGTLPVINKEAVKSVLKVGIALGSELADFTEFDRKNYFYPDIPKGYQISQYKYPLVSKGSLNGVDITRIHLEEDTARSAHDKGDYSLVDFNRSSVPLMELVTEPVIHSAEQATDFAKELQLLLRYLDVAKANMEKGEMRVEANISISDDPNKFGTKVEVKNLNSFKAVEKAVAYEIERMTALLDSGGKIVQETRGWDENKGTTFSQRKKENSHDYRYFPDPDLPKLKLSEISEFSREVLKKELPEFPWEKRARYIEKFGLKPKDAEFFVSNKPLADFFESAIQIFGTDANKIKLASNYIVSDLAGLMKKTTTKDNELSFEEEKALLKINPKDFADLIVMITGNEISSRGAKDILNIMYEKGGLPKVIAEKEGLLQKSDTGELQKIAEKIVADNQTVVADYKAGKAAALMFLVGQGMKASKGSANPAMLKEIFLKILS